MPVVYTDTPFDSSMILDMRGIDDKFASLCPLLFKSKDWAYEKEWRVILPGADYTIPHIVAVPHAITGVFLGINSYSNERDELEEWAERNGIPTHQMQRYYCSFDLVSDPISEIIEKHHHSGLLI